MLPFSLSISPFFVLVIALEEEEREIITIPLHYLIPQGNDMFSTQPIKEKKSSASAIDVSVKCHKVTIATTPFLVDVGK